MLQSDVVEQLTDRHRRARLLVSNRLATVTARAWDGLGSWDDLDVARLAEVVAPSAELAQTAVATRATGFYSAILEVRAPFVRLAELGVALDYRQAFTAHWHALAEGRPFDEALSAGRSAAEAQADRFLTTTARRVGDSVARSTGQRVRWRRVPEPKACRWCLTVAGQLYRTAESADFGHDRCHCDPVPVA